MVKTFADFQTLWGATCTPNIQKIRDSYLGGPVGDSPRLRIIEDAWIVFEGYQNAISKQMSQSVPSLDRHKIAACMAYAILKTSPIPIRQYDKNSVDTILNGWRNEFLAWRVSLSIVLLYSRSINKNDIEIVDGLNKQGIILPRANHDDYEEHIVKSLRISKNLRMEDTLLLSNILFQLEYFTIHCIKASLKPARLEILK